MAFVSDLATDEQDPTKKAQEEQDRVENANPATGGGTSIFGNTPGAAPAANGNPAPKANASGNWTNLSSYLDANKDQSAGMADKLAGNINDQGQKAQQDLGSLQDQFNQGVTKGGSSLGEQQGFIDDAIANPTKYSDAGSAAQFQKDMSGKYGGPKALSELGGYGQAQTDIANTQGAAGMAGSEAGRQTLLSQQYGQGGKSYSQGEKNLDSMLLDNDPNARSGIQNAANQWTGLQGALSNATSSAQDAATKRAADTAALGTYAGGAINTATGGLQNTIQGEVSQKQQELQDLNQKIASKGLTSDDYSKLGISNPYLYTNNPTALLQKYAATPDQVTAGTVASPEQQAQYAALMQLAGQQNQLIPAGSPTSAYSGPFNVAGLQSEVTQNKAAYDQAAQAALNDYNTAVAQYGQGLGGGIDAAAAAKNFAVPDVATFEQDLQHGVLPLATANPTIGGYQVNDQSLGGGFGVPQSVNDLLAKFGINSPLWQNANNTPYSVDAAVAGTGYDPAAAAAHPAQGAMGPQKRGARMAHGGEVQPAYKVPSPPKEPGIPKMPKADNKLPKMPHFAEGGDVLDAAARAHIAPKNFAEPGARNYPIHDIEHARNALARVAQDGSPKEQEVVRRQVAAHYPSLAKEHNFQAGGQVPGKPKVDYNSFANDVVKATLSPKEVVLPLSVTQSRDPVKSAADFMAQILAEKARK